MLIAALLLLQDADGLLRDLADEDPGVRDRAMEALIQMGPGKAGPILERAAAHRDPEVRARARAVRGVFNPPPEIDPLVQELGQFGSLWISGGSFVVSGSTIRFESAPPDVAPLGPAPRAEDVRAWIRDLSSASLATREAAYENLRAAGRHVEAELTELAASADREVAYRAQSLRSALLPRVFTPAIQWISGTIDVTELIDSGIMGSATIEIPHVVIVPDEKDEEQE